MLLSTLRSILLVLIAVSVSVSFASEPRTKSKPKRPGAYKKKDKDLISQIVDGRSGQLVKTLREYTNANPDDLEAAFCLTVALGQLGETEAANEQVRKSLAAGMPVERFLAGPRNLLEPVTTSDGFKKLLEGPDVRLLHGPMLGCVTDRSAKFWVRTADEVSVQVSISTTQDLTQPIRSATEFTTAERDFTTIASVERIEPNTTYYYDVQIDGKGTLGPDFPSFRTFPTTDRPARFEVGFGGGAGFTPWKERMWDTIASHRLIAFLLLGDNVYIDMPKKPEVQQYCYYRRQSRTEYRRFARSTSIFAIWDDHDFGTNDCWVTSERDDPPWKRPVWRLFRDNWNNPSYGGGEDDPGCWFRFRIADVDFFMLDGRYYRSNPRKPNATMLGPIQKEWLLKELKRSDATFKVLASPVPWVLNAKGNSLDTWRGFEAEREEIFGFLESERIDGVVLLSADRHRSDYWRIDRPGGYPFFEFESSRLTNVHVHGLMPGSLFGYNEKCSFGKLTFDTTRSDPQISYQITSIDNELIHTFTLKQSQISHR